MVLELYNEARRLALGIEEAAKRIKEELKKVVLLARNFHRIGRPKTFHFEKWTLFNQDRRYFNLLFSIDNLLLGLRFFPLSIALLIFFEQRLDILCKALKFCFDYIPDC